MPLQAQENNTKNKTTYISLLDVLPTAVAFIPFVQRNDVRSALQRGNISLYETRLKDLIPSSFLMSSDQISSVTSASYEKMSKDSYANIYYAKFYGLLMIDLHMHQHKIRFIKDFYDPDLKLKDDSINLTIDAI